MTTFTPNDSQRQCLDAFSRFLDGPKPIFILKGSAGTGKTTLVKAIVTQLQQRKRIYATLAPTGRAARILGAKTQTSASTIHSAIYALDEIEVFEDAQGSNDPGMRIVYALKQTDPGATVFIVDEASMVGDRETKGDLLQFGSGRLLSDLIAYARLGRPRRDNELGTKIVFVGDPAQLPPVGDNLSPALSLDYLKENLDLECVEFELTEVMRQAAGSAVLDRATAIRDSIRREEFNSFNLASVDGEISAVSASDAVGCVTDSVKAKSSAVLITYTNAAAREFNRAVRARLWGDEMHHLRVDDLLLVNKNSPMNGLFNGDLVKVVEIRERVEKHVAIKGVDSPVKLTFRSVSLAHLGDDAQVVQCQVLENLLESPERELSPNEQRALLVNFRQRFPHLKTKSAEFRLAIRQDEFFNALQIKYGYAMTCHKAQGGEWDTAVVNFSDSSNRGKDFFRWSYTAITRSKKTLLTINAPNFGPLSAINWDTHAPKQNAVTSVPVTDPDWDRFSFKPGQEPLFEHHLAIRDAVAQDGAVIETIEHLSYRERYFLQQGSNRIAMDYQYKGNFSVSQVTEGPRNTADRQTTEVILSKVRNVLLGNTGEAQASLDPFLIEFRNKVESALVDSGIHLLGAEALQYRFRLRFDAGTHSAQIDFHFNGKKQWTRAEEVGGRGSSHGIFERVHQLIGGVE